MRPLRPVAAGALIVAAAAVGAWALAYPQAALAGTLTRAVADCAAVVTLGLAVVPWLDTDRYRGELTRTATTPLAIAAAVWLLTETVRVVVQGAHLAGVPVWRVSARTTVDFAVHTAAGRSALFSVAAAALVAVIALAAPRGASIVLATVGIAAAGMAARSLTGHLAESPVGGAAVAVHALAAALWCGALAALLLTVSHRGRWARVLPRFSQLSLWCVAVLLVCGVAGALALVPSPAALVSTGYGRVLTAKIIVTATLIVLAWHHRTRWLPAARAHRATAAVSRTRSQIELALMAVALTGAAALTVTG